MSMVEWQNAEGGPRNIGMCVESAVTCWKLRKYCGGHQIIVYFMKSTKSRDGNTDVSSMYVSVSRAPATFFFFDYTSV